jgi:hypothetical protein
MSTSGPPPQHPEAEGHPAVIERIDLVAGTATGVTNKLESKVLRRPTSPQQRFQQAHQEGSLAFSFSGGGFMLPYFAGALTACFCM